MTDLEGIVNRLLEKGVSEDKIISRLMLEYSTFKDIPEEKKKSLAEAVLTEVKNTKVKPENEMVAFLLTTPLAGATMHELGVGCRGRGDFFVHRLISSIPVKSGRIPLSEQDDAGVVTPVGMEGKAIVAAVDGTHSRLSNFPFVAGFHVARAAIRDVMAKGAKPIAMVDDVHLGDDGDVGKLFDFVAGVAAISELTGVPLISGSTLRIGGDMVIGDRMVSCVAAIGIADKLFPRREIRVGDDIIMTRGSGGGTITTAAIYSRNHDALLETINIDFFLAYQAAMENAERIHAILDITNGGVRGDATEVSKTTGLGLVFFEKKLKSLVSPHILSLLENLGIDYLGVSLASLMVFCPPSATGAVLDAMREKGVEADVVGTVVAEKKTVIVDEEGEENDLGLKYRESAYTPLKMVIGEEAPENEEKLMRGAERAAREARKKMERVIEYVRQSSRGPSTLGRHVNSGFKKIEK